MVAIFEGISRIWNEILQAAPKLTIELWSVP